MFVRAFGASQGGGIFKQWEVIERTTFSQEDSHELLDMDLPTPNMYTQFTRSCVHVLKMLSDIPDETQYEISAVYEHCRRNPNLELQFASFTEKVRVWLMTHHVQVTRLALTEILSEVQKILKSLAGCDC
jgi:hypothetical protein